MPLLLAIHVRGVFSILGAGHIHKVFIRDLAWCKSEVIIESPFMTMNRINILLPYIQKAVKRGVKVIINTKHPQEHDEFMCNEVERCIGILQDIGVEVLFTGGHHRKLAIFDRVILWEGSLNILSQNDSCEIMRRIISRQLTDQMIEFSGIGELL
jgi:PLD-like domain